MTALSADKVNRSTAGDSYGKSQPVAASTTIYQGALCAFNASGFIVAATDAASLAFAGIAAEYCDNSSGSNGDDSVVIQRGHIERIPHTDLVQADVGKNVVIEDSNSVTDAAGATNDLKAGTLLGFEDGDALVHVAVFAALEA